MSAPSPRRRVTRPSTRLQSLAILAVAPALITLAGAPLLVILVGSHEAAAGPAPRPGSLPAARRAAPGGRNQRVLARESSRRYRRGTAAYRKGDYDAALRHFQAAADLVYRPSLSYNIALCYEKLEKPIEAIVHLRRYLASKPPPEWARRARDRLKYLLGIARVEVEVTSYPAGAAIYLDSREAGVRGRTPFTMKLKPGSYTLYVEAGGYLPAKKRISVDVGGRNYHDFQLKRQSSLKVAASVAGARVVIDGQDPRHAPLAPVQRVVAPGRHKVRVEREGYHAVEREVDVQPGDQTSLFVDLRPLPRYGILRVKSNVAGATVQVESDDVGVTPLAKHRLLVGTYRVYVRKKGYQTYEQRVTILADQASLVRVTLIKVTSRRQLAWMISGTALTSTLIATGVAMTLTAANVKNEYDELPRATLRRNGKRFALAADALFATGVVVGLITVFVSWRLKPDPSRGEILVTPLAGPGVAGVVAGGSF